MYRSASNVAAGETLFEAYERFSVGVLATGTEIHEGRQSDLDSPMLCGLVQAWGGEATYEGTVPDEAEHVSERIDTLAHRYDVVLTTGGTSVGTKDYVIRALDSGVLEDVDTREDLDRIG